MAAPQHLSKQSNPKLYLIEAENAVPNNNQYHYNNGVEEMNITIVRQGLRTNEVYFSTEYGEGKGIWNGGPAVPGTVHEVEFELTALFMRWVDIVPASHSEYSIKLDRDEIILTGVLENLEEDGTGYLRLAGDLIMFECLGEPMALGGYVEIRSRELAIYPVFL